MQTYAFVFHVELRQFPHVARAFNLTKEELSSRILGPWVAGAMVQWEDRRWAPERARLTVYEGRALRTDEIGLGRGWANVIRNGKDVTEILLAEGRQRRSRDPALDQLEQEVLALCADGRIEVSQTLALAGTMRPEWRLSNRLALAEGAVWELLHQGLLKLTRDGDEGIVPISREDWGPALLDWSTWADRGTSGVFLEASGDQ